MIQEAPTLQELMKISIKRQKVIDSKLDEVLLLLSGKQKGPEVAEQGGSDSEDDPNYITVRDCWSVI